MGLRKARPKSRGYAAREEAPFQVAVGSPLRAVARQICSDKSLRLRCASKAFSIHTQTCVAFGAENAMSPLGLVVATWPNISRFLHRSVLESKVTCGEGEAPCLEQ
jgi:hypothetical protein